MLKKRHLRKNQNIVLLLILQLLKMKLLSKRGLKSFRKA